MRPLLIVFTNLGLGGVQRKIVDIVNFLSSKQPDLPICIILRHTDSFDLSTEIKNKKVTIINYQKWARTRLPFFFPLFVTIKIWQLKPQAVLAFLDLSSVAVILARIILFRQKFRLVLSEDHYTSAVVSTFKFGRIRNFLISTLYPLADTIFACSQTNKQDLVKKYGLPADKIKIIRNWTTFTPVAPKRKEYDLIYAGRLVKKKNLASLIYSLQKIKNYKRDLNLCLIGTGEEEQGLKELARRLKLRENVLFLKPTVRVDNFLSRGKIFVFPCQKYGEGFPLAILEAMALKIPVLSHDFSGAREFLKDGQNCCFFKSEKEMINKIIWLLENPLSRREMTERAYKYVKKYHNDSNIRDYLISLGVN